MADCAKKSSQETLKNIMQVVRQCMLTLHHSLEFVRSVGLVFDYLFVDSYRYESILRLFVENA